MTVILVVTEINNSGKYDGWIGDRHIVAGSSQPFVTTARKLIAEGVDPETRYIMPRQLDGIDSLTSTVGVAAKLRVTDDIRGTPRFRPHRPYDPRHSWRVAT